MPSVLKGEKKMWVSCIFFYLGWSIGGVATYALIIN
jgi:hypothetical protein